MSWYRTGTVQVTNGSPNVVGTGTAWVANIRQSWAFAAPDGKVYEVLAVPDDTHLTLATDYAGSSLSGQAYQAYPTQGELRDLTTQVLALINDYGAVLTGAGAGKFADGSVGAPGVSFASDVDTGFYRYAANAMGAATGGSLRLLIDSAGRVGLGTTAPVGRLNIVGGDLSGAATGLIVSTDLAAGRLVTDATTSRINALSGYYDTMTLEMSAGSTSGYISGVVVAARSATSNRPDSVGFWTRSVERAFVDSAGNFVQVVQNAVPTLTAANQMVLTRVNDTTVKLSMRGADGTTRSVNLTLA